MNVPLDAEGNYAGGVEIYQLTAPNGKVYVGQAQVHRRAAGSWVLNGAKGRWRQHMFFASTNSKVQCRLLYASMRKHGSDNFQHQLLETVPKAEADECEIKWIAQLNALAPNGLNLTAGGGAAQISEETRYRMSEKAKLRKASNATRLKMSKSGKGRVISELTRETMSKNARTRAATSGLPTLISRCGYNQEGLVFQIRRDGVHYSKTIMSSAIPMKEKLRLAVEARDKILKDLGLPAITDDPAM